MKKNTFTWMHRLCWVTLLILWSYVVWWYTTVDNYNQDEFTFKTQSNTWFSCSSVTAIPTHECEALVDLYENTNWKNWSDNSRWLKTQNPCTWRWVLCEEWHVATINLSRNNVVWSIPDSISDFSEMFALFLWDNSLSWSIPQSLWELSNLRHIELWKNGISWEIPSELWTIWNLTTNIAIFVNENNLCGTIPSSLKENGEVKSLHVDKNNLTIVQWEYNQEMREWINDIVNQWSQSPESCN